MNEDNNQYIALCEDELKDNRVDGASWWRQGAYEWAGDHPRLVHNTAVTVTVTMTANQALEMAEAVQQFGTKRYAPAFDPFGRVSGLIGRQAYKAVKRAAKDRRVKVSS
jgi:hypothetical protein